MRIKIYILAILSLLSFIANAQKDGDEEYMNFERNYNELLQSYYIQTNEKALNERFNQSGYTSSSRTAASVPDYVYENRLKSLPSAVDLVYNQRVRNHIIFYVDRMNRSVSIMLGLSKYYFPIFENILDSYGVPTDLKYLVVIESAFNPKAVSVAGASGLWQFMYATGKMYDLRENSIVDDRRDPIKATVAAAKYLRDLYNIYNDWSLVLAAYNCGPGNVNKAMKRSGRNNFWDIYNYLPRETRNYVPAFIAATYVMNFYSEHGIRPAELTQPLSLVSDTVMVNKDVYFGQIADVLQIPEKEIESLNPQYKMSYIPGTQGKYSLKLPFEYIDRFIENEDSISNYKLEQFANTSVDDSEQNDAVYVSKTVYHKVKKREGWSSIAKKYGVTVSELRSWNRKVRKNKLRVGTMLAVKQKVLVQKDKVIDRDDEEKKSAFDQDDMLKADNSDNQQEVFSKKSNVAKQEKKVGKDSDNKSKTTQSSKNDNRVAADKGKKVSQTANKKKDELKSTEKDRKQERIADKNDSKSESDSKSTAVKEKNKNKAGSKQSEKTKAKKYRTYVVKSGETISSIAKKHGLTEKELIKLNGMNKKSADKIRVGQKIKVK